MPAPKQILDLIARFDRNRDAYRYLGKVETPGVVLQLDDQRAALKLGAQPDARTQENRQDPAKKTESEGITATELNRQDAKSAKNEQQKGAEK